MEFQINQQQGISLIELMVGLAIGLVLAATMVVIYLDTKHVFRVSQARASIQENGRHGLHLIKEDLRLAGFWGLNYRPHLIDTTVFDPVTLPTECDTGWASRVSQSVFALNGTNTDFTNCIPDSDYQPGTDILTIRHASSSPVKDLSEIKKDRLYLYTSLTDGVTFQADDDGALDADLEAQVDEHSVLSIHELVANAYYIRPWSRTYGDGIPTLVREELNGSAKTGVSAQPLVEFVEDFQVAFGLDTDANNNIDYYEDDASTISDWNRVVTVVLEILVRSPMPEAGYVNNRNYRLGDRKAYSPRDNVRRQVFRETVFLRNWAGFRA